MTVFFCPHCNNRLEVDDSFAGRDGWCRKCKNMITVPRQGPEAGDSLSPSEKYERLAKAFQHAATKADKYQIMLLRSVEEKEHLESQIQELLGLSARVAAIEKATAEDTTPPAPVLATPDLSAISELASALETVKEDVVRLAAELERNRATRSRDTEKVPESAETRPALEALAARIALIEERASLSEDAIERLRDDLEARHRAAGDIDSKLDAFDASLEALRGELENVREQVGDASSRADALRAHNSAMETKIDAIGGSLDAIHGKMEEMRPKLGEASSRADELQARASALEAKIASEQEATGQSAHETLLKVAELDSRVKTALQQLEGIAALARRNKDMEAQLSEASAVQEALQAELETLKSSFANVSESLSAALQETKTYHRELEETTATIDDLHRTIEAEKSARMDAEHGQEQYKTKVDGIAAILDSLKQGVEMLTAMEAVQEAETSAPTAFDGVSMDASDRIEGTVVHPEVIEENAEAAQQMMLNTFLRFMHSAPRDRR